jgi:hypothetical protein
VLIYTGFGSSLKFPHGVQKPMNLYKAIDVWKKADKETAIRYRCFEALDSGRFCVQSADFYTLPLDAKQVANLTRQFVDLFIQQNPAQRSSEYSTLGEAIAAHDKAFETA